MASSDALIATTKAHNVMSNVSIDAALQAAVEGKTVAEIAQAAGVTIVTFYAMLDANSTALSAYTKARDRGYDALADSMMEIADNEQDVQRARLKCDNIKWLLSRRASQRYGDKITMDISGQVDLTAIMADSAKRLRPMRDLDIADAQLVTIESSACDLRPTDSVSDAGTLALQALLE